MALTLTEEQTALAQSVQELARREISTEAIRTSRGSTPGEAPAGWDTLVEQGLTGLHLPESAGGAGATPMESAVAAFVAGRCLLPGCFVASLAASEMARRAGAGDDVLATFADGTRGAVVRLADPGPADADRVAGRAAPAVGAAVAQTFVVLRPAGDGAWHVGIVAADADGVSRQAEDSVDLAGDVATVTFDGARIDTIGTLPDGTVTAVLAAYFGAQAAGVARWALEAAVDYAKTREQFGVAIGSFQAIKHKAARMAVAAEIAAGAAWGAAASLAQDEVQQAIAGGSAALVALRRAPEIVTEAVTIFGGIGFTWEHEAHLYLRRALAGAGVCGSRGALERRLGEIGRDAERRMEIDLPDEDPAFRAEIGALLDEAATLPEDRPRPQGPKAAVYGVGPRRTFLAEHGLVTPHWPKPWGRSATSAQQVVIAQEFARRGLAQPTTVIGEWAMPTVFSHGSDEQKERLAGRTTTGDIVWCQLFSEPGAGSDLASLRTRAEKVDGGWRIDGQKVWTSSAHDADWGICLARTDTEVAKHKGLSFFLVDMTLPGITVRPIRQSTGDEEFNEVFLDGVVVPDDCLVGEPGQGWRIAMTTLANERTSISSSVSSGAERPLREAIRAGAVEDTEEGLRALGEVVSVSTAIGSLDLAETMRRLNGLQPGAGSSLSKVAAAELSRSAAQIALDVAGPNTALASSPGEPALGYLALPQQLIGGGTIEIQLNVIAERVLGLPRG